MMIYILKWFSPILLFLYFTGMNQNYDTLYVINDINIIGNKKTKANIILRELEFSVYDTIFSFFDLLKILELSQNNLMNTLLFNKVLINPELQPINTEKQVLVTVNITLTERWYIWPIPYFNVEEHRITDWFSNHHKIKITYGLYYFHDNLRGRREQLLIGFKTGFNQSFLFKFNKPYLNKKQTLGLTSSVSYNNTRNVFYSTINNKEQLFASEHSLIKQKEFNIYFTKRHKINQYYQLQTGIMHAEFDDTLFSLNNLFMDEQKKYIQAIIFSFYLKFDYRDYIIFPLKGYYLEFEIQQKGFNLFYFENINISNILLSLKIYNRLIPHLNLYFSTGILGRYRLDNNRSYFFRNKLRYNYENEYVRGYESYVIDTKNHILNKNNLIFPLLTNKYMHLSFIKNDKFSPIPVNFYLHTFVDMGYACNPYLINEYFINKLLMGFGIGLTFTTYYNGIFRIELSKNIHNKYSIGMQINAPL